jgi:hypothetical protein
MKVIYKKKPKDGTKPKLTKGKEYLVLGISNLRYRILDDESEPILYSRDCFEVTDPQIPSDWIRIEAPEGAYRIEPKECSNPGFYEDYFDGVIEAQVVFNKVLQKIIKSYSTPPPPPIIWNCEGVVLQ